MLKYIYQVWNQYGEDDLGFYTTLPKAIRARDRLCTNPLGRESHPNHTELTCHFCGITRHELDSK